MKSLSFHFRKTFSKDVFYCLGLVFWVLIVTVGTQYVITYAMLWLLGRTRLIEPLWTTVTTAMVYLASALIIILLPRFGQKLKFSRKELGLSGLLTYTDIGIAILGYILVIITAGFILTLLTNLRLIDATEAQALNYQNLTNGAERIIAYIGLAIIAPIAEEIVFRGWLYGKLRQKIHLLPAILLTSILFGFLHGQWNVGITVGILSIVNCLERELTGTIYAGILTHMIQNSLAFALLILRGLL